MEKKMKFVFYIMLFIGFGVFLSSAGPTVEKEIIVVATDATWPPMEFVNQNKKIVGFDIDLMKEIAKQASFSVQFKNTAWDGIFVGLANKKYDVIIADVTITEERKKTMDFSIPYLSSGQILLMNIGADISNIDQIPQGSTIGAQLGTTGAFTIQKHPNLTLKTYDELGFAIEDLINKKIDGVVTGLSTAANFALQNVAYKGKLKMVGKTLTSEQSGIVTKKGNTKLLKKINAALQNIKTDGTLEELKKKWLQQ